MKLEGIHHVTCITGNAPANVEFYADTLGLRLVKKTVNQDDPTVYHLFYADEKGSAGADITFFEYPGAPPGRAGDGMVHRVVFRVASEEALDFWAERAGGERRYGSVLIHDPEGLALELVVDESGDEPLVAEHPEIPPEHALRGFAGVRAYSSDYGRSAMFLWGLGFTPGWEMPRREARRLLRLRRRRPRRAASPAPGPCTTSPGPRGWRITRPGGRRSPRSAGSRRRSSTASTSARSTSASRTACCSRSRRSARGSRPTSRSRRSGERLSLPPDYEQLRPELERRLTPLPSVR